MDTPKRLARAAGILYLLVAILGGFAQGFVYPKIYAAGDAAKTTGNVLAHATLVRAGITADLFQATVWVVIAMILSQLLGHVHAGMARAMVVFAAIGAGITCLNTVFELEALRVAGGDVNLSVVGAAGSGALVLLLADAQHYGIYAASIFFGLWLAPMGYLVYKSGWFPKLLGVVLIVGCVCYLVDALTAFLPPGLARHIRPFIWIPAAIAEVWMVGYLLAIGVKTAPIAQLETPLLAAA